MRLLIISALICAISCKPEGYYRQEYQFKKSSSSYKNNQLEAQENDEGFYKKQGDLEGKVAPNVNQHNEHREFSNPDLTGPGHTVTTYDDRDLTSDAERAFSKLGGVGNGQSRSYSYANSFQSSGQRPTYTTQSNLRQITHNLQQDMSQQVQEACRNIQGQSYSSEDVRLLENELKANLTRQLQQALRTQYGSQGSRDASSYSIVNGAYNTNANYDNQELTDLSQKLEQNLIKQLRETIQTTTTHQSSSSSSSTSNHGRTTGWNTYPTQSTGLRRESAEVEDLNSGNTQRTYVPHDDVTRSNSRQTYLQATSGNTNTYQRPNYGPETTQYRPESTQYRPESTHYRPESTHYRPESTQYGTTQSGTTQYSADTTQYRSGTTQYRPDTTHYRPDTTQYRPTTHYIPSDSHQRQEPIQQSSYTPSYNHNSQSYRPSSYSDDFPQLGQTTERIIVRPTISITDVLHNVQTVLSQQVNDAVRCHEERYSSSSFALTDSRPDFQSNLNYYRRELKNNITRTVQEALDKNYGPQIRRGEYSFSSGSTNIANYRVEDMESLKQQIETNLIKHLEDSFRAQETRYTTKMQQQTSQHSNYNHHGPGYTAPLTNENYRPTSYNQHSYSSSSTVNTELGNIGNQVQEDLTRQLNAAMQKQQSYSSSSSTSSQTSFNELSEELKRNLTRNLEEKLREHYGRQGSRGGYSYTVSATGVLNPKANYNAEELSALTQQLQDDLNRQLNEQLSRQESSSSYSQYSSNTGNSGNYYQPTRYTPSSGYNSGIKTHGSQSGFQKYSSFSSGSATGECCTQTRRKRHAYQHHDMSQQLEDDLSQQPEDDLSQQPEDVYTGFNSGSSYSQHSSQYGAHLPPQANPATAYHSTNFGPYIPYSQYVGPSSMSQSGFRHDPEWHRLHPNVGSTFDHSDDSQHSTNWHHSPSMSENSHIFNHHHNHHPKPDQSEDSNHNTNWHHSHSTHSQHSTHNAEWHRLHPNVDSTSEDSNHNTDWHHSHSTSQAENSQSSSNNANYLHNFDHPQHQNENNYGRNFQNSYKPTVFYDKASPYTKPTVVQQSVATTDKPNKLEPQPNFVQNPIYKPKPTTDNYLGQQTEDDFGLSQQTEDLTQQSEDLTQQIEDVFSQQTDDHFVKLEVGQQTENQFVDDIFGQQTDDDFGKLETGKHSTVDGKLDFQSKPINSPGSYKPSTTYSLNNPVQPKPLSASSTTPDFNKPINPRPWSSTNLYKPSPKPWFTQQYATSTTSKPNLRNPVINLGQQTEDLDELTQQTEDKNAYNQQTEDDIGQLNFEQVNDLTQQTENGFGKLELGQQQTQDFDQLQPIKPLLVSSQRKPNQSGNMYGQQTEDDFGQLQIGQVNDLTQQTENGFGKLELGQQQTQDFDQLQPIKPLVVSSQRKPNQSGNMYGQQTEDDFGQLQIGQVNDLTQQTEDGFDKLELGQQQTQDFDQLQPIKPLIVSSQRKPNQSSNIYGQQTEDDFGQLQIGQENDLTQQTEDEFGQTYQLQPIKPLVVSSQRKPNQAESMHGQDLTQQTNSGYGGYRRTPSNVLPKPNVQMMESNTDFLLNNNDQQQLEDIFQNTDDIVVPISLADAHRTYINKPQYITNPPQDMTFFSNAQQMQLEHVQQSSYSSSYHQDDLSQHTDDLSQHTDDLSQHTDDLNQHTDNFNQHTDDLNQHSFGYHNPSQEPQMVNQHSYSNFGKHNGDDTSSEGIEEDVDVSVAPKHYEPVGRTLEVPAEVEEIIEVTEAAPVGFWKKVGGKITSGFNTAKEKAKGIAEKINLG